MGHMFSRLKAEARLLCLERPKDFGIAALPVSVFFAASFAMYVLEGAGFAMFLPLLEYVQKGMDMAALQQSSPFWGRLNAAFHAVGMEVSLLSLIGLILVLMGLRVACEFMKQTSMHKITLHGMFAMREKLMAAYMLTDTSFFYTSATGRILNVLTTELPYAAANIFARLSLVSTLIAMGVYMAMMLAISWKMTLTAAAFIGAAIVITTRATRATGQLSRETTEANGHLGFALVEHLNLFRLHKLTATEALALAGIRKAALDTRAKGIRLKRMAALVDAVYEPVVMASTLLVFYVGVQYFHIGLGGVGLFLVMLFRLLPICKAVIAQRQSVLSTSGSLQAVLAGLDEARANADIKPGGREFEGVHDAIVLENVSYQYPGQAAPVLHHIGLVFPAGKMTAIAGPSGAGKSTLADLLPRLRLPQEGRILFDGMEASGYDIVSLRRGIAFLSQEPFIFNDTLLANIVIGRPQADLQLVWSVLDKVRMGDFVRQLPDGLHTVVGERGTRLSGGQKQRLALARVLIQHAPVIILDEPTSALDSETESAIQETLAMLRLEKHVTMIVIAHRMSTIRSADRIAVIKDGRVLQSGTHDELLASNQWYTVVHDLQLK